MKYLMNIMRNIQKAVERQQITRVRAVFMGMSDRQLKDIGVSRELLKKGCSTYPWRAESEEAVEPLAFKPKAVKDVNLPKAPAQPKPDKSIHLAPGLAA